MSLLCDLVLNMAALLYTIRCCSENKKKEHVKRTFEHTVNSKEYLNITLYLTEDYRSLTSTL